MNENDVDCLGSDPPRDARVTARLDVITRQAGQARKPPKHPKYAFRAALQASRELKGATKLVGLLLADFVNVEDGYAYPTLAEIMDRLGLPESTVKRALGNLQGRIVVDPETGRPVKDQETGAKLRVPGSGWYRREPTKSKNGADYRNHFHPNYAKAGMAEPASVGGQNEPLPLQVGGHERPPRGPSTTPHIHTGYSRYGIDSQTKESGGKTAAPFSNEDSVCRLVAESAPTKADSKKDRPRREWIDNGIVEAGWTRFEAAYPHKPALKRAKGMFFSIVFDRTATVDELVEGAERYAEWLNATHQAGANATGWLRAERWTDRPAAYPSTSPRASGVEVGKHWSPSPAIWKQNVAEHSEQDARAALSAFRENWQGFPPFDDIGHVERLWEMHIARFCSPF